MHPTEQDIAELYDRYAHVVYLRAFRITGDEALASDAVQETFARVIRGWETFREEPSPLLWMVHISTRWCLRQPYIKRERSDTPTHHRQDIIDTLVFSDDADRIRRLLSEADDETRRIVAHIYFDEMTREETAVMLGLSVPAIRRRLKQFMRRSRRALGMPAAILIVLFVITSQ